MLEGDDDDDDRWSRAFGYRATRDSLIDTASFYLNLWGTRADSLMEYDARARKTWNLR